MCWGFEDAVAELEPFLDEYPTHFPLHRTLIYAYWQVGDVVRARQLVANVLKSDPRFSSEDMGRKLPFEDPTIRGRIVETWKKAGFPKRS